MQKIESTPEIIVAMSKSGIIGKKGKLPWKNSADLDHFRRITTGHVVIMGRKTFESLPKNVRPLPDRTNIVVSTTLEKIQGGHVAKNLKEAIRIAQKITRGQKKSGPMKIFLIGGAGIYQEAIKKRLARKIHISIIAGRHLGDTRFPKFDKRKWQLKHKEQKTGFVYQVRELRQTKKRKH